MHVIARMHAAALQNDGGCDNDPLFRLFAFAFPWHPKIPNALKGPTKKEGAIDLLLAHAKESDD
eukprot:scaffold517728_cov17-Prasinocladus_malaysianus.AAC.1